MKQALIREVDGKLCIATHADIWLFVRVYIYILHIPRYLAYVPNPESAWKILWTRIKKEYGRLGKLTLDSSIMKKTAAVSMTKVRKWINPRPALLIAVRERMQGFYSVYIAQFINMLWHCI